MSERPDRKLHLTVDSGPHVGQTLSSDGGQVCAGRGPENEFCLGDDQTVSERHARFYCAQGYWFVEDCGSRNGVYVFRNGQLERLSGPELLQDAATIHLGATRLRVALLKPSAAQPIAAAAQPLMCETLEIRWEAGAIRYRLSGSAPVSRVHTQELAPALVEGLVQRLEDVVRLANLEGSAGAARAWEEIRSLGAQLTRQLVPERVLEKLAALEGQPLQIAHDSELIGIPWELASIGGTTWGEYFDLGRQVILENLTITLPARAEAGANSLLIVCNPTGDLAAAQEAGEALLRELSHGPAAVDVVLLAGARATAERLLREMERCQVVYYLGHGHYDATAPERSGWLLHDGPFTVNHFRRLQTAPRLVFSNACDSAREAAQHKGEHGCAANVGMASKFLFSGVEAFVGALWPIQVESSAYFASVCFQDLLGGAAIGGAVRRARRETRLAFGGNDLSWASYVLYGDPRWALPAWRGAPRPVSEV
ncbi:MAG: CHAT domain-containing protein [Candidatus Hydrogenedentes bacterium]|nr:CHAT domain-containing protein [Candidatus Hydrogenedentota bacterium]